MSRSLWGRLLAANLILLPLFLGATGLYLERSFKQSLDSAAVERLQLHVLTLLAEAEYEQSLTMPPQLLEDRFSQANSGLAGAVTTPSGDILWASESSIGLGLAGPAARAGDLAAGEHLFHRSADFYHYALAVLWRTGADRDVPLVFHVLETTAPTTAQLASYRRSLLLWLGGAALGLMICQLLVLYWGLRPLARLARDIAAIEAGHKSQLDGIWPREVEPITRNLARLLAVERERRERTRNTLADLAHSLKSPLSVMRSADTRSPDYPALVAEQSGRMQQIVSYQLQRAGGGSPHNLLYKVPVRPVVERLRDTLQRVYPERSVNFEVDIAPDTCFRGDERDLMECLGNLMDNACKYGASRVRVNASQAGDQLVVDVEDDGPGIPQHLRDVILARGVRADSVSPGQGIGLAVAADIAASYNGSLVIRDSELGGAGISVRFG